MRAITIASERSGDAWYDCDDTKYDIVLICYLLFSVLETPLHVSLPSESVLLVQYLLIPIPLLDTLPPILSPWVRQRDSGVWGQRPTLLHLREKLQRRGQINVLLLRH